MGLALFVSTLLALQVKVFSFSHKRDRKGYLGEMGEWGGLFLVVQLSSTFQVCLGCI